MAAEDAAVAAERPAVASVVVAAQAEPASLKSHWHKFWALRQVWEHGRAVVESGRALRPVPPPAGPLT